MASSKTLQCGLKICDHDGQVSSADGRVEVRGLPPSSGVDFQVSWSDQGDATFHRRCWSKLLAAVRGKDDTTMRLSPEEQQSVKEAQKTAEFFDSQVSLDEKAGRVAELIRSSKHCVVFTGAGISTAAGIGDFRGKAGKWTENDKVKTHGAKAVAKKKGKGGVPTNQLRPTYTHEALVELCRRGLVKFVISQNTDGLHRLSGVPQDKISELHGNCFIERCEKCKARYERPHHHGSRMCPPQLAKKCKKCRINHRTGRTCEKKGCDGALMNTIINFGDNLESQVLERAEREATCSDVCIALGSTLRVTPAADLVSMGKHPLRLVIVNRQPTPYDDDTSDGARVYGDCDDVMRGVMKRLMTSEELETWHAARPARLASYDEKRQ